MDDVDVTKRILSIRERISSTASDKAKLEGELESRKKSLAQLIKEIKERGYDPKKLKSIRTEKQKELEAQCAEAESQLDEIEAKLKDMKGD